MITKDLGAVSAYAYAVEKGYTGTEAEYAELMASYADVAQQAEAAAQTATEKAQQASASATSASQSASTASASAQTAQTAQQTATAKASEAQQSATTATTKAQEASQSASESSQSASTAVQAKQDAQTAKTASETAQASAESARDDAESARDEAQQYAESIDPQKLIGAYPVDTASGSIASFTDGADNIPMKSVKVRIEPVQDLHGQDAPYPAGGGKNLFETTATSKTENGVEYKVNSDGSFSAVGTVSSGYSQITVGKISLPAGSYVLSDGSNFTRRNDIELYIAGATPATTKYSAESTFTLSEPIDNKNVFFYVGTDKSINAVIKPMIRLASVSDSTYAPYSNICPISGWDDNNVYIVDLTGNTPVLDGSISLGTSGYTTAVIDALNGIAYIFHRDTRPNTEANYNFIVYDYINSVVKSTRIINKFGAMQAADLYNGKIAIMWGMGTAELPSGMAVYSTTGDMLAEYKLSIFANTEPEGVCFDRDTGDLLISMTDSKVYRIIAL